jgi:hypothetical protein
LLAEKVRSHLGDDKRLLRIYGSEIVVGRLLEDQQRARLLLLNYGASRLQVNGLRIRVRGFYSKQKMADFGAPAESLLDAEKDQQGVEFTVKNIGVFAVIDLEK